MHYLKNSKSGAENKFISYQNFPKIVKFLLSLSLFSLLFSSLPFLFHSLGAFLMKIFGYSISKNYMLLLYNDLLVFIVKNSGLIHDSSSPTTYQTEEMVQNNVRETGNSESEDLEITEPVAGENGKEIELPVEEEEEEEKSLMTVEHKYEILNSEESGDGVGKEIVLFGEDMHDVEETEKLNKKCEDFIRRIKAGFRSEPRTYNYSYEFDHQVAVMAI